MLHSANTLYLCTVDYCTDMYYMYFCVIELSPNSAAFQPLLANCFVFSVLRGWLKPNQGERRVNVLLGGHQVNSKWVPIVAQILLYIICQGSVSASLRWSSSNLKWPKNPTTINQKSVNAALKINNQSSIFNWQIIHDINNQCLNKAQRKKLTAGGVSHHTSCQKY